MTSFFHDTQSPCRDMLNLDMVSKRICHILNYFNELGGSNNSSNGVSFEYKFRILCYSLEIPSDICDDYQIMNNTLLIDRIKELLQPRDCQLLAYGNATVTCDNSFIHKLLVGYCFPVLLTICVIGNIMNLLVYTVKDLRKSTTVKMLMAKSVVNILFMLFLLPLSLILLNNNSQLSIINEESLWRYMPYFIFLSNVAGTCAAWLTVMMTFERYLFITYPMRSRLWCTTKNFLLAFAVVFVISCLIYIEIPATRETKSQYCKKVGKYIHKFFLREGSIYQTWETLFYWTTVCWHGILPNIILTFCTARIAYELIYRSLPAYSERKHCVTRITLATTVCHLVLESPAIVINIVAAFYGPAFMNTNYVMCVCHVMTNFASQLNASVCCLIYLSCSSKYRSILITRLQLLFNSKKGANSAVHNANNSPRRQSLHNAHLLNSSCYNTQLDDQQESTPV